NFGGVGMEVGMRQDILTIIAPLKGSPAERAGLLPDDKIIEIDGESTAGLSIDEAVYRIRGEIGTDVKLTLLRDIDKGAFDVTITRDTINVPVIDTEIITPEENPDKPVFVVSLYSFTANSPGLFQDALREFAESGSTRLILDLRGNPGGYMEAAVEMASWFLPSGKIVVKEIAGKEKEERVHRSRGYNVFNDSLEMVILVNKGSASASEILAGALSEHGVAQIIGTKTFGKGSVQELIHITPDASLKITVSRWFTPNGISISEEGLSPDIEVDVTEEDIEGGRDPQMDRAVAELIKI
ncbi:S41 family peptidase, partial [bacterium]|nr:S41 family peptidase [bacterium]